MSRVPEGMFDRRQRFANELVAAAREIAPYIAENRAPAPPPTAVEICEATVTGISVALSMAGLTQAEMQMLGRSIQKCALVHVDVPSVPR